MDSHINGGVPISATQAAQKVPFAISTGIRAPLTIDDNDFEYSADSGGKKGSIFNSYSSDGELEFDEFETASGSDKPFLADPDEEILEESEFLKEHVVSRPVVVKQIDDDFDEESSDKHLEPDLVGEGVVSRSIVGGHSYEQIEESINNMKFRISTESLRYSNGNDSSEEFSECRTSVADTEEDALGVSYEADENDSLSGSPIVENANDLTMKQSIPIAPVCWSSDDDFLSDELSSDGSVLGSARVVDFNVTERIEDVPKIRVLNVEEVENSALYEDIDEEDSAISDSHDEVILNSALGDYLKADAIKDNFAENTEKVNEGFEELRNINAIENLGSKQAVQKSDEEVRSHDSDVATYIEFSDPYVMEEEGQSLNNVNRGEILTTERSETFGNNSYASETVQSLVMEDEYYSGSSPAETLTTLRSDSFENNCDDVDIIQSLFLEDEYYSTSEVSQAMLQNSMIDLSSILGEKDSVLLESEDVLNYDETLTREGSDRASDVVLPEQNLAASLSFKESVENDLHTVGAQIMFESEEELEARADPLGEEISASSDIVGAQIMSESEEELEAREDPLGEEISASAVSAGAQIMSESEEELEAREDSLGEEIPASSDTVGAQIMSESKEELEACQDPQGEEISASSDTVGAQIMSESEEELEAREDPLGEEISASSDAVPSPTTRVGSDAINVTHKSADSTSVSPLRFSCDFGTRKQSFVLDAQPDNPLVHVSELMARREESGDMSNVAENKKLVKLQQLGIKFLRLALRLNQSFDDTIATKVLNQIFLAAGRPSFQSFNFEFAKQTAILLEAEGADHLDFSLNVLVIGKSGVGKSATINSLFGEYIATTSPFQASTAGVKMITGTVNGVHVRVLDTPGLRSYPKEQSFNHRVLLSIKKHMKKFPPDVVLYVDRLDMQYEDLNDIPLLKSVTRYLGSSVWFKTIVILTHATSTPPEVLAGSAFSYQFYVNRQSQAVQQLISHASGCGDEFKPNLIHVSLVENLAVGELGENVDVLAPDESIWREKLLFLCYSLKILSEMDSAIKPKAIFDYRKFFGFNNNSIPILDDENSSSDAELKRSQISTLNHVKKHRMNVAKADVFMEDDHDFNGENLAYKYLRLESRFLHPAIPVLNFQAWEYDCGYNGVDIEDNNLSITGRFPGSCSVRCSIGPSIKVGVCSKKIKKVSIRIKSSDDISLALLGLLPFGKMIFKRFFLQSSER